MKKIKSLFSKFLSIFKRAKKVDLSTLDKYQNSYDSNRPFNQPFIIHIQNTTDDDIENVSLFFANNQNDKNFDDDGNYVKNGLIISSGIAGVTYNQMVKSTISEKINAGFFYIKSMNIKQILLSFRLRIHSSNGNLATKTIVPTFDPYQQQTNIVGVKKSFVIDSTTEILLKKVYANTNLMFYVYPVININKNEK
jgi:hypothetical protein